MSQARRGPALVALAILGLLGVVDGAYLTQVHLELEFNAVQAGGLCTALSETGCQVTGGRFGAIGGLPVAVAGAAGSAAVALLALFAFMRRAREQDALRSLLFGASSVAVLASALMASFSLVEGKFCPFCVLWYGINLLQFGAAWLALDRGPLAAVGAAVGNLVRPMGLVAVGTFGAALVVGWLTYDALHDRWAARRPPMQAASEITALQIPPGAATKRAKKHAGSDVPAAVSIVEFSDFECPFCKGLWDILVDLIENTELDIQVTYVHFPLDSKCNPLLPREMHPNACAAARAAECAGKQGKFWEMGSKLFTNQAALEADRLVDYAAELGLDVGAFLACSSEPSVDALVRAHTAAGEKAQIEATPTLFINGRKLEGAPTRAELERTIRGILEEGTAADGAATATKPPKG